MHSAELELDLVRYELRRNGQRVRLERQAFDLLILLAERNQGLVTREEIAERLWGKGAFRDTEQGINNAVRKIRLALQDNPEEPRYLETVVGRGYRLIASVHLIERQPDAEPFEFPLHPDSAGDKRGESKPASHPFRAGMLVAATSFVFLAGLLGWRHHRIALQRTSIRSLAVLPLENLSGNPDEEYFADGMTDELITDLAKIGSLHVISRTSSMRYKSSHKPLTQIARELNVDAVVEGSMIRSSDRLRITAQLVDAHSDRHLWAENYDRPLGDAVILQDQIAAEIVSEVRAKLTRAEDAQLEHARQVNPVAYEAYLKGRFHFNKRTEPDLRTAIDYFNRAIAVDPQYAMAYVGLADSYNILGSMVFTAIARDDARSKAMMFAAKALQLDDTLGEAHTALADARLLFDCDWKGSEAEFRRALALTPNYANAHHWYAELLIDWGRFDESIRESYKARQLDPLSAMMNLSLADRLCSAHRCNDGLSHALAALELDPNLPLVHTTLSEIYRYQGRFADAIAEARKAAQLSDSNPNYFVPDLAYAFAASGDRMDARRILQQLQQASSTRYVAPYQFAVIYAALGEKRNAVVALDQAYKERSPWLDNLYLDSLAGGRLASLRTEPEFIRLLHAVGPPETRF